MSRFAVAAAIAAASTATATAASYNSTQVADLFADFKSQYGKTYSAAEEAARLNIFSANLERAAELNAIGGAEFGVTKFADLTAQEFKRYLTYVPGRYPSEDAKVLVPSSDAVPSDFDWRDTTGVVSKVKNQGNFGSCWAYSTTEAIESQWVLAGNSPVVMSAQQIISCDRKFGDEGCNGGDTITAYEYVKSAGGLATEEEYPETSYKSGNTGTCKRFAHPTVGTISGNTFATKECTRGACNDQDEDTMAANVHTTGPASICVNAEQWQLYSKGVLTGKHCGGHSADDLDHCVQVVGFSGYGNSDAYWIVRNSWAEDWGIKGYIHVELGDNACGIANEATFPTIAK